MYIKEAAVHWKESAFLMDPKRVRVRNVHFVDQDGKIRREVWEDILFYYSWDWLHGEIEAFRKGSKKSLHFAALDKDNGKNIKQPDPTRFLMKG